VLTNKNFYIKLDIANQKELAMDKKIIIEETLRLLGAYLDPTFKSEIGCLGAETADDNIIIRFCSYNSYSHSAIITTITINQEVLKK
jgi:hypothetical protein